jgi:hypothetical protein
MINWKLIIYFYFSRNYLFSKSHVLLKQNLFLPALSIFSKTIKRIDAIDVNVIECSGYSV